ncbi:MAG: hypothetical protein J7K21_00170 [Desulfurococcales archaeon]|nr:hypothetical protein [Desulfurococcales archaeon]
MVVDREAATAWTKLLRHGKPVTVRGFQRLMGYRSPGKAQRILERLRRLGLVERTMSGEYVVSKSLPPYLAAYTIIKGYIIPRSLVSASFATTTALAYSILVKPPIHLLVLLLVLIIPYWVEVIHNMVSLKKILRIE